MDIQVLFRPLEQMERSIGGLYEELARVFSHDREASRLFEQLAKEEKSHLSMIQFEKRILKQNPGMVWDLKVRPEAISDLIHEAAELRTRAPKLSLEEAVKGAIAFESADAENHGRELGGQAPPELGRLLQSLRAGDRAHREALEQFARSRGFLGQSKRR